MKKLTLNIEESKFKAFLSFIKTLDYVIIQDEDVVSDLQKEEVLRRMELFETGKMKTRTWEEAKTDLLKK